MSDEEMGPSPDEEDLIDDEDDGVIGDEEEDEIELDEVDVRDLLRAALETPEPKPEVITEGVQRRIRERTKGRYFADGWSTSTAPKATFLVTSVLMLVVLVIAWLLLTPRGLELLTR